MQKVKLGASGIEVSRLGYGCMGLAEFYGTPASEAEAHAVLDRALDLGITFLDTADMYGSGLNEEQLSGFLKRRRNEVVLATKFGIERSAGAVRGVNNRPDYIHAACDASLRRLGVDVIDLYYMHRRNPEVPVEDSVGAMADLVKAGKVRALGLSEVSAETLRKAHAIHPITALQSEYSIMTRVMEAEMLPLCRELGVAFVAYSPLGRGLLTGAYRTQADLPDNDYRKTMAPRFAADALAQNIALVDRLASIAKAKGASLAQTALAWLLAKGDDVIPIPGTKKVSRLEENIGALDIDLTTDDLAAIEAAFPADAVAGARYPETSSSSLNR